MGCSKNLIDSERLIRQLNEKGYSVSHNPETPTGEYVVVNTCGFIADAKEESIDILLQLSNLKESHDIGKIIAMGCLTERYRNQLTTEIPEIDIIYGKFDWTKFIQELPDKKQHAALKGWERTITTAPHNAYLKISEGCNRMCAFCAIPLITGRHKSRPIEEILEEVKSLTVQGVKEFNIIAQDLSSYGLDLYKEHKLAELVDRMAQIDGVKWIRLHYAYPSDFPYDILDVMAKHDNVCKYMDIALQHASDKVLSNMRRHITKEETEKLLEEMRRRVPGIKIRTTLMVGFPGEDDAAFEELIDFVKTQKFDRMGAFAYSEEEDTYGARNYEDNIPADIKQERLDKLMSVQEEISSELNSTMIGDIVEVVVDEIQDGTRLCRSQWDSPEVDQVYYVNGTDAQPGDFIKVRVEDASEFELFASPIEE